MQMNKQTQRLLFLFGLLTAVVLPPLLAVAQSEPAEEKKPVPVVSQAPKASDETDQQEAQKAPQQTGDATTPVAKPVKEFKPTDKIGADRAVSFPIDI
jgi:hypothetical protein